ncbi:NAD(P)/FAD-dependent oxidoreductase [Nanoarchaeota archaeon]
MYETIIIGAGIAGLTAAMYASRKKMNYEVFGKEFGGQFQVSGEVLNYPGIVKTTGVDFMMIMQEQMKFNQVNVKPETVKEIQKQGENFKVITDKGEYETETVIIASGSFARKLNVPGEAEFDKKGVTYCSVCDGPLFKQKPVIVIGGGDSAMEAVDFMKNISSHTTMLVRGPELKGHKYLMENIQKLENLEIIYNAETTEILGDKFATGLKYKVGDEEHQLDAEGIIVEIGRIPTTDFVKDFVELDDHQHIVVDCQGHTNIPGIFAAGDCASGHEYQYVLAAGQGCMSLLKAARYLAGKQRK